MKRVMLIAMCCVLLVVLAGCGSNNQLTTSGGQISAKAHGVVAKTKLLTKEQLAEFDAKGLEDVGVPVDENGKPLIDPAATDIPLFTNVPSQEVETPTPTPEPTPVPTPEPTEAPVIHITYQYEGVTEPAVLATLPEDDGRYHIGDGQEVEPDDPMTDTIELDEGTWKFGGWIRTESENGVDLVITGIWTFEPRPTEAPTEEPTATPEPTPEPTVEPTVVPTVEVTEAPVQETPVVTVTEAPVEPTKAPESALNPLLNSGYRFQNFVLEKAGVNNAVFSGEAILSGLSLWNSLTVGAEHDVCTKYIGRDYLDYESSDALKYVRKIWLDSTLSKGARYPRSLEKFTESLSMTDPSATSKKNAWVLQTTSGYFNYTPAVFDENTLLHITSEVYFRDSWKSGMKPYDTKERIFKNLDGTTTLTTMMRDEGLTYWRLGNAVAYCMYFTNGDYLMVILPDEGVAFSDVDVRSLMTGKIPSQKAHVRFFMPEFSTECSYTLRLNDFMLTGGFIDTSMIVGLPENFGPIFTQVDKVSFSRSGAGGVTTDVVMNDPPTSYSDDLDVLSIVCDRPFMYYIGDSVHQDIALFGVLNTLPLGYTIVNQP